MSNMKSKKGKDVLKWTTNNSVYNKTRKRFLENKGLIHCAWCGYHRGENRKKWFGGYLENGDNLKDNNIKYPSWKLSSRNRKQWMPKNRVQMRIKRTRWRNHKKYVEFTFSGSRGSGKVSYSLK